MDVVQIAELLGNVGEFIGSILVLVTLIYLALQVKQSKELLEKQDRIALSQVHQARTELRISHAHQILNSGCSLTINKLFLQGESPELTELEHAAVSTHLINYMAIYDNAFYQAELGLYDQQAIAAAIAQVEIWMPIWKKFEIPIFPRVQDFYDSYSDV